MTRMRTGSLTTVLVLMAVLAPPPRPSLAQQPEAGKRAAAAQQSLEDIEKAWAAAVETNDPNKIGRFFTDDFLFVGAGGVLQNRTEHLDDFASGRLKLESVQVKSVTAHAYDAFAVVNTLVAVKGKFGDRDITGDYRFMDTFRRTGKEWSAVARQQTRVAVPPPAGGGAGKP
jgi:ketosteroid isomerase-like protein